MTVVISVLGRGRYPEGMEAVNLDRSVPVRQLVLLSDSTGDLGERFIRALMSQFPREGFCLRVHSFIQSKDEIERVFRCLNFQNPIIFHTTLDSELKHEIERWAAHGHWPVYDLTGGAMRFLEKASHLRSSPNPTALHALNTEYEQRIRSLEFTVNHDDGLNHSSLEKADVILVGVSRTSKTPTSIYLAYKGFRVANVPLIPGVPFPMEDLRRRRTRVVGLTIEAEKLRTIRLSRAQEERIPGDGYTRMDAIRRELEWADSVLRDLECPVVDVTSHAVEETAALVLKSLSLR